jgi:ABC-type uncharacterized transport system auxiliary subunit
MQKIDPDILKLALRKTGIDVKQIAEILEEIAKNTPAPDEKEKPAKKQFVVVVPTGEGGVKADELAALVFQIPEEDSPFSIVSRVEEAARAFNATAKGRRIPVETLGDAVQYIKNAIWKDQGVLVKTKDLVSVVFTTNAIAGALNKPKGNE